MAGGIEITKPKIPKTWGGWKVETEPHLWFKSQMQTVMAEHPPIHPEWKFFLTLTRSIHNKELEIEKGKTEIARSGELNADNVTYILERVAQYIQHWVQGRSLKF